MAQGILSRFLPCIAFAPAVTSLVDYGRDFFLQNCKTGEPTRCLSPFMKYEDVVPKRWKSPGLLSKLDAQVHSSADNIDEPLQIVEIVRMKDKGEVVHKLELNEKNLERIMRHKDVVGKPVVIVSVAGSVRTGKSFLMGFFLKYMENGPEECQEIKELIKTLLDAHVEGEDWLTDDDELKGFEWRGGSKAVTLGIQIWSKPFIYPRKNKGDVAVLLMDTQGVFDNTMTRKDCISIFAISSLMSSVQVFNIYKGINEENLQNIQFFTEYGKEIAKEISGYSDTSKTKLVFLVRDWPYKTEYPCGRKGGKDYVKNRLQKEDGQHAELRTIRTSIESCFPTIEGFLLPYPGKIVDEQYRNSVKVAEMNSEFMQSIKEFLPYIISEEKLVPKTINDREMEGEDILEVMKILVQNFEKGFDPISAFEATVDNRLYRAKENALRYYQEEFDKFQISNKSTELDAKFILRWYLQTKAEAEKKFDETPKINHELKEADAKRQLQEMFDTKCTEAMEYASTQKEIQDQKPKKKQKRNAVFWNTVISASAAVAVGIIAIALIL